MALIDGRELRDPAHELGDPIAPSSRPRTAAPFKHWVRRALTGDLLAAGLAAALASVIRFGWDTREHETIPYAALGVVVTLLWPVISAACGGYDLRTSLFGVEELRRVLRGGVTLLALLGMAHFVFKLDLSRGYVGILFPLIVGFTALARLLLRRHSSRWMRHGRHPYRAVAVGPVADLRQLHIGLASRPDCPIELVAFVADDLESHDATPPELQHLVRLPARSAIDALPALDITPDLLVRAGRPSADEMAAMTLRRHQLGVPLAIAPSRDDTSANLAVSYVPLGGTPLLVVETPTLRRTDALLKAALDRSMALLLLVALSPVLLLIAALIAARDGRPVLFTQERVGLDGRLFRCLKFRTMELDAEHRRASLTDRNQAGGPLFKIRDDPRVTPTGRWLRRHSLDELPQLVNVLRGDMSIVGPRPALPTEVATFDQRTRRRLLVKPGITGLWQVEGRSDLPWDDGVYLDLMYVDHWSPLLDLVIMARTAKAIVRPNGAY